MPSIFVNQFGGKQPKVDPQLLENHQAQTATNCNLRNGILKAMASVSASLEDFGTGITPRTLWKMGSNFIIFDDNDKCSVVDSSVDESNNRIYYTGDGFPKKSDDTLWGGGSPYRRLGITKPSAAPTVTIQGVGNDETQAVISYVYTCVSSWGEESAPSPATGVTTVEGNQYVDLSDLNTPAGTNNSIQYKRIYRVASGKAGAEYFYLGQIAEAATTFQDKKAGLNELENVTTDALITEYWDEPPATMEGLIQCHNGILAGYDGKMLCLSEPNYPYAWPVKYQLAFDTDITGLGYFNEVIVVFTKRQPYIVWGSHPENMAKRAIPFFQTCVSQRGVVGTPFGVLFPSKEGLCLCDGKTVQVLTRNWIDKTQWSTLSPNLLNAVWYDDKYYGFFEGTDDGIIINTETGELVDFSIGATSQIYDVFHDPVDDKIHILLLNTSDSHYYRHTFETTGSLSYVWKSKRWVDPYKYTCAKIRANFGSVTFKFFLDGSQVMSQAITSGNLFRLPAGRGQEKAFQLEGTIDVESVQLATSPEELI